MMLAVKCYLYVTQKPAGIPDEWPADVVELGEAISLPPELSANDGWILMTLSEFQNYKSQHQATYNTWLATNVNISAAVEKKIIKAMNFGTQLIAEYASSNVLSGYSTNQVKDIMTRTANVQNALRAGSLYVALDELALLETDDVIITAAKITVFRNKIQSYLGLPLT